MYIKKYGKITGTDLEITGAGVTNLKCMFSFFFFFNGLRRQNRRKRYTYLKTKKNTQLGSSQVLKLTFFCEVHFNTRNLIREAGLLLR